MADAVSETVRIHAVRTPEGVWLPFRIASIEERIKAFLIDWLVISTGTLVVWLLAFLSLPSNAAPLGLGLALLASFLLRNFYFILWEVNHGGATLGKRATGLRVISRDGGPLTAEAVFARNLTRDVEIFLPLAVLLVPQTVIPGAPAWAGLAAGGWLFVFAALPLCNKDRLRCGDLVAGTLVVHTPVPLLLHDVVMAGGETSRAAAWAFSREQLDIYGIHELQVLEDLLRRDAEGTVPSSVLGDISERIQRKIGWPREHGQVPPRDFLRAFYAAQRGRLEQKLLFGQRQERKRI
jgi:uncharacterized RDD family membrane protein YckC